MASSPRTMAPTTQPAGIASVLSGWCRIGLSAGSENSMTSESHCSTIAMPTTSACQTCFRMALAVARRGLIQTSIPSVGARFTNSGRFTNAMARRTPCRLANSEHRILDWSSCVTAMNTSAFSSPSFFSDSMSVPLAFSTRTPSRLAAKFSQSAASRSTILTRYFCLASRAATSEPTLPPPSTKMLLVSRSSNRTAC